MRFIRNLALALISALFLIAPVYAYAPPPATTLAFLRLATQQPRIQIQLPPKLIMTPAQLTFPQSAIIYNFNAGTGQFSPNSGLFNQHRVTTSTVNTGDAAAYVITITGWKYNELPNLKDFRLTFASTVTKDSISKVENYLKANGSIYGLGANVVASLTGVGCAGNDGSHICLTTITSVRVPGQILPDSRLQQTIPLKGIFVEGNAAAPSGQLQNFSFSNGQSIAIGNSVTNVSGGQVITGYPTSSISPINWATAGPAITAIYNQKSNFPMLNLGSGYSGSSWNLNTDTTDPANSHQTSFSTPPEGKLWNIVVSGSRFDLGSVGNNINFTGFGTLVVSGDKGQSVDVFIHNHLTCASSTRLGMMTMGSINFVTSAVDHQSFAACGAYASLNGNISFDSNALPATSGSMTGLFIAKGNVVLPNPNTLTGIYQISRDSYYATHPTVLFQNLLKLVFSTTG